MGSLKRKFDLTTADEIMPRKYGSYRRYGRRYRRYKPYRRSRGLTARSAFAEINPTHTFTWLGNAGSLTVSGINNRHGILLLNTAALLPNSQGFLKIRDLYTMYKITRIKIRVMSSDDDSLSYNFTVSHQYNPVAVYPAVNDSDNQIEGANTITKMLPSGSQVAFYPRWNTLRQTYSSLVTSGYEATTRNNSFYTTGGAQSGNITDVHFGRLVVSAPGAVLSTSTSCLRIVVEFTAQFSNPNFNA